MKYNLKFLSEQGLDIKTARASVYALSKLPKDELEKAMNIFDKEQTGEVQFYTKLVNGECKRFFIDPEILVELQKTKNKDKEKKRLPFETISIVLTSSMEIELDKKVKINASCICLTENVIENETGEKSTMLGLYQSPFSKNESDGGNNFSTTNVYPTKEFLALGEKSINEKSRNFARNLISFLTAQNIEAVSPEKEKKSVFEIKEMQTPYKQPSPFYWLRVKHPSEVLTQKQLSSGKLRHGFNYQFDVRGHYRHYNSPRYVNVRGQKVWIPPMKRGSGIYISKNYFFRN